MNSIGHGSRALAIGLAGLAGYVDAIGYLQLGGYFVSFMSGNSTRLALGLTGSLSSAAVAAGLILAFVIGVVAGALVGRRFEGQRRSVVLGLVAIILVAAATLGSLGFTGFATTALAVAMGAENAVFERDGEVHIGLTYMTGTLVRLGQRIAGAVAGGDRWAWVPHLLLWAGLVSGAVLGAVVYRGFGLAALWPAVTAVALLALGARRAV